MKRLFLFWMLIVAIGCETPKNKTNTNAQERGFGLALTASDQEIVNQVQQSLQRTARSFQTQTKAGSEEHMIVKAAKLNDYELSCLPFYELDLKAFSAAPSPEKLHECIKLHDSFKWIFAWKNEIVDFRVIAQKKDGSWRFLEMSDEWGKHTAWLEEKLEGVSEYRYFMCGIRDYFEMKRGGEYYYYRINGMEFSAEKMCEYFVDMKNAANEGIIG